MSSSLRRRASSARPPSVSSHTTPLLWSALRWPSTTTSTRGTACACGRHFFGSTMRVCGRVETKWYRLPARRGNVCGNGLSDGGPTAGFAVGKAGARLSCERAQQTQLRPFSRACRRQAECRATPPSFPGDPPPPQVPLERDDPGAPLVGPRDRPQGLGGSGVPWTIEAARRAAVDPKTPAYVAQRAREWLHEQEQKLAARQELEPAVFGVV